MRRIMRFVQVQAGISCDPKFTNGPGEPETRPNLNGYIQNRPSGAPPGRIKFWRFRMVEIGIAGETETNRTARIYRQRNPIQLRILHLRPIGRLVHVARSNRSLDKTVIPRKGSSEGNTVQQPHEVTLRPVQSGESYRITSPLARGQVRPELAKALETVFEQFARERGFSREQPLEISLSRGYKANSHGHKEGRAADIDAVGGKSFVQWKQAWDQALAAAEKLLDPGQRSEAIAAEQRRNLGYRLYKALQAYGGWRVNPGGWRVYQNVMQLFGPWTATEGPWKAMQIENPNPKERQRLADQRWVFQAHEDHIHVAR